MKFSDLKDIAMILAIGYVVYLVTKALAKGEEKYEETVQTVSDWLSATFGPDVMDPIQFSPYTKPDGTRGSRITRVVRLSDNQHFAVDYSGSTPRLVPIAG